MLTAFTLFANPANHGLYAAIDPWSTFLIIMLAFGGAVLAARAGNGLLTIGFFGVALLYGVMAASASGRLLKTGEVRLQTLEASLEARENHSANIAARQDQIRRERDSLRQAVAALEAQLAEKQTQPTQRRIRVAAAPAKPAVKPVPKPRNTALASAEPRTAPRPQTYAAPNDDNQLKPQTASRYKHVGEFRYGIAPVKGSNNKWGYINENGDVVVAPFLRAACTLSVGLGGVKNDAGRWGYVDRYGRVVIPYLYTEALAFEDDSQQALVQLNGQWVWINTKGQVMRPAKGSELRARKRIQVAAAG